MAQRPSRAASKQQLVVPKVPPVTLPSSSGRKWRHAAVVIGLWCATFAAYSNSFRAALSFDSVVLVARDTRVHATTARNVRLIWGGEYWHKIGATGLYRPLTTFSFLFNYAVLGGGTDAAGYHWLNFGLHGVNILLVYLLAFTVLGEVPIAAVVAGLWALHPVSVEAVTNIAGRADLLAAVGVLLGLLCHVRAADAPSLVRRLAWLALLILAAAIGIFSKENAITLPAAMLAFDVALRLRRDAPAQRWRTLLPGYLAVAVPLVFYVAVRAQVLSPILAVTDFLDNPLVGAGFRTSRLTAIAILGKYLGLLVWPARLSADYSYHQIPLFSWSLGSWTFWSAALSVAVWSAILLIAMRSYRSRPSVFFFIAFFAVTMAPSPTWRFASAAAWRSASSICRRSGSPDVSRSVSGPPAGALPVESISCGSPHLRWRAPSAFSLLYGSTPGIATGRTS